MKKSQHKLTNNTNKLTIIRQDMFVGSGLDGCNEWWGGKATSLPTILRLNLTLFYKWCESSGGWTAVLSSLHWKPRKRLSDPPHVLTNIKKCQNSPPSSFKLWSLVPQVVLIFGLGEGQGCPDHYGMSPSLCRHGIESHSTTLICESLLFIASL